MSRPEKARPGTELAKAPRMPVESGSHALLEALAAGIAHEVRNPLNALQLNVELLDEELRAIVPDHGARVYAILEKLSSELRSLDAFVSEFLRYARPPPLRLESVPIRPLLAEFAGFVAPSCAEQGLELALDLDRCSATVSVDALQLKRAILNLVLNAIQATPAGGRITLESESDDAKLIVRVRDTGPGLDAEHAARIFDVFFTTKESGSGLGLPIARRIAEAHGGTLALANHPEGGALATLELPARRNLADGVERNRADRVERNPADRRGGGGPRS
jgi:signal transduction histidine kinase